MAASKSALEQAHQRYEQALQIKSGKLSELDHWYRLELASTLQKRQSSEGGAYLTTAELVKLMKWKLTRGKFRPRLERLAQSNEDELVRNQTSKAFDILSRSDSTQSAKEALTVLNVLKGVGPATSSAILAAFHPDKVSFMSDEALEFAAGLQGKPKYTVQEWKWFNEEMRQRVEREAWNDGCRQLEEAAWAFAILTREGEIFLQGDKDASPKELKKRATSKEKTLSTSKRTRTK